MTKARQRGFYFAAALMVVASGLLLRSSVLHAPPFLKKYGADALWALLVFLLICVLSPRWKIPRSAGLAAVISAGVEVSQLYHALWIDALRATRLGALVLGSVFNWPDFPAYATGIALGALLDAVVLAKYRPAEELRPK
ncbi:MAG: DUF2809 domain-containing protein [Chthoniobacter sp.]|nr:DUF2809 domain-containing protein [Chthoniobacter sp.]